VFRNLLVVSLAACAPLATAHSQNPVTAQSPTIELTPTAAYLAFGTYFTGPGGIQFSNEDGFGYGGQVAIPLWKTLSLVASALHGTSNWSFEEVPLVGRVTLNGASLWLFDAGLRATLPLGAGVPVALVGQVTAGAIRYAVDNPLIRGQAINFAFGPGAGLVTRLGGRLNAQVLVKDYVASFRSVDDAAAFGVEGRRAHTVAVLIGLGISL